MCSWGIQKVYEANPYAIGGEASDEGALELGEDL
jgi:hypothetical protein